MLVCELRIPPRTDYTHMSIKVPTVWFDLPNMMVVHYKAGNNWCALYFKVHS